MNLVKNKGDKNDDSSPKITHILVKLLMIIIDTPEKDLYNGDGREVTRKVRKYSVKWYLTLFLCSIRAIYNRVYRAQNPHLVVKLYIPGIY